MAAPPHHERPLEARETQLTLLTSQGKIQYRRTLRGMTFNCDTYIAEWRHGPVLYSPPSGAIVTELKVKPVPIPMPEADVVKPKPVVAKKKPKTDQRWFW